MRFNFEDYLNLFSVDDLRELAQRRGFLLAQSALNSRQTLVRRLSATLERPESVYPSLFGLNAAELAALGQVVTPRGVTSASSLAGKLGWNAAVAASVLDGLRRLGLLFPEGNWESIVVPPPTRAAIHYLPTQHAGAAPAPLQPTAPALVPAPGAAPEPRIGTVSWDVAEILARVQRSRMKLTQAGRINRRDLKALEGAFPAGPPAYTTFLYVLTASATMLIGWKGLLTAAEDIDRWLSMREEPRLGALLQTWVTMRGFAENVSDNPEDAEYAPGYLPLQRMRVLDLLAAVGEPITVESLAGVLAWQAPLTFQQWDGSSDSLRVTQRILRSLYWLGVVALDDPEKPAHFALTPAGARTTVRPDAPAPIPEEAQFFLQPNAEIFAPPNLQPRTLFHLRRITGEKKGGPAGMFPLTADSVRRALDSGLTADAIVTFLERFSRTGLPENVRTLVETAGRQHGRIRLVPASYVVVTADAALMQELRSLKTVAPLLEADLTAQVATVDTANVPELTKRLRARGYAPSDAGEVRPDMHLPDNPEMPQTELAPPPVSLPESGLDWSRLEDDPQAEAGDGAAAVPRGEIGTPPDTVVTMRGEIVALLQEAITQQLEIEIGYHGRGRREDTERVLWPLFLEDGMLEAYCTLRQDYRNFAVSRIAWARLTGEIIPSDHVL